MAVSARRPWGRTRPAPGTVQNWSRAASAIPIEQRRPASVDEVCALVRDAADRGLPVHAIGAGHSFSSVALTDGVLVDVSALSGVRRVDGHRVTFGAGTRLHEVPALLAPFGLALENMGDIDRQTLAGATSTGTHGTGLAFGGLATRITAATLVTASGELRHVGADDPLLPAVRIGLGALGVLVELEIDCVPAFLLHAVERAAPMAEVLDGWVDLAAGHDHYEAYWWPHTERMSTKAHARLPLDAEHRPQGRLARTLQAEVLGNGAGAVVTGLGLAAPALTPGINRVVSRWFAHGERTGPSPEIFTAPRRVRFTEMEYALPLEALPSAVRELQRLVEREGWRISFPVELGTAAADDTWLSTAYGRATSYVAVHRYWREDWRPYFTAAEAIFRDHDGRPHWGKLHTRTHDDLLAVCPRLADVAAVRDRLDPDEGGGRRFTNDYVAQVLGD